MPSGTSRNGIPVRIRGGCTAAIQAHGDSFGRATTRRQAFPHETFDRSLEGSIHDGVLADIGGAAGFTPAKISAHPKVHTPLVQGGQRAGDKNALPLQNKNALRVQFREKVVAIGFGLKLPMPAQAQVRANHGCADGVGGKQGAVLQVGAGFDVAIGGERSEVDLPHGMIEARRARLASDEPLESDPTAQQQVLGMIDVLDFNGALPLRTEDGNLPEVAGTYPQAVMAEGPGQGRGLLLVPDLSQASAAFVRADRSSRVVWPFRDNRPGNCQEMPADSVELRNSGSEGLPARLFRYSLALP